VTDDEIELLESGRHTKVAAAKAVGLQLYWGNFGLPGEHYLLFVGKSIAKLGPENSSDVQLTSQKLMDIASYVSSRLVSAGFAEAPLFHLRLQPDS